MGVKPRHHVYLKDVANKDQEKNKTNNVLLHLSFLSDLFTASGLFISTEDVTHNSFISKKGLPLILI